MVELTDTVPLQVPAVMSDRYARLDHGYSDEKSCSDYEVGQKPQACLAGSADAQNAVAAEQFIANMLTLFTSSLVGSLSDEYGRKGAISGRREYLDKRGSLTPVT